MVAETFNLTVAKAASASVTAVTGFGSTGVCANFFTPQPGEKVTIPLGASSMVLDLGAGATLRQVMVGYTNLVAGDTIRVRCSASADGITSPLFDTGAVAIEAEGLARPAGYRHWFYHHTALVTARYVRIDFSVAAARTGGLVVVSAPLQLEYNPDFGETSWGYEEADEGEILDSGVEVLVENMPAPVLNFTATWVTQAEMDAGWHELGRLQWEGTPVLVARRPDPYTGRHNGLYWGRLRMVPMVAAEFDMYEVQGRIRSLI